MTKQLKSNGSQVVNLINLYLVYKTNKLLGQDRSKMRNGEWELAYVCFAKTESEARFTTVYTGDWAGPLTIELLGTTVDRKPGVQVVYHRIPTSQEVRENFIDPWDYRDSCPTHYPPKEFSTKIVLDKCGRPWGGRCTFQRRFVIAHVDIFGTTEYTVDASGRTSQNLDEAILIPESELDKYPVRSGVRIGAGSAWNVQLIQAVATPEEIVSGHDFIIVSEGK